MQQNNKTKSPILICCITLEDVEDQTTIWTMRQQQRYSQTKLQNTNVTTERVFLQYTIAQKHR